MTNQPLELTREQQQLLLRGLRFVRSSVALEVRDYSDDVGAERQQHYARIGELEELLNSAPISEPTSV